MIELDIPGFGKLEINHLVLDFNGTIAFDGKILTGVKERLLSCAELARIHIITADTFGEAMKQLQGIPCKLHVIEKSDEDRQKQQYVQSLGAEYVAAIGNGNIDRKMLKAARLGIAVLGNEGCATSAIQAADIIVKDVLHGLDLLLNPLRCKATLRF